jgi:8-oxo-dGTP pyrophosphatase MutT (NUDIX family)
MKQFHSAGGVVIRKISGLWHVLLIRDQADKWTFPKGIINEHEQPLEAAIREIREEVGLTDLRMVNRCGEISYIYNRNGENRKTVSYFLFISGSNETPVCQTIEGIREAVFMLPEQALKLIGYPDTNMQVIQKAISLFPSL